MTTATKKTEDMTVAETLDAIFGDGTAEQTFTPEELEVARQPYSYTPPAGGRNVRLKVTPSGHVSPTHPDAPLGRHGSVRTVQINSVPPGVSLAEVVRLYAGTVDLSDSPMWEYERIGVGRILR
jgi:hypothetical protein